LGERLHPLLAGAGFDRSHVFDDLDVETFRRVVTAVAPPAPDAGEVSTRDSSLPGPGGPIRLRTYRRDGAADIAAVVVWAHGGGFVAGGIASHDAFARRLAVRTGCEVVVFDYRLAPEHPYPAGALDTMAVVDHALDAAGDRPVVVGGDSAGGALALGAALDRADRVVGCVALYPMLADPARTGSGDSYAELSGTVLLGRRSVERFWGAYLPSGGTPAAAVPARRRSLAGSPPLLIVAAHVDVLRDEALRFAARAADDGVTVELWVERDAVHGFFGLAGFDRATDRSLAVIDRFVGRVVERGARAVSGNVWRGR